MEKGVGQNALQRFKTLFMGYISRVYATKTELNNKVDKVAGMGLSSNDFDLAQKTKLLGIEENANKYILPYATPTSIGGVKIGSNINMNVAGVISCHGHSNLSELSVVTNANLTLWSDKTYIENSNISKTKIKQWVGTQAQYNAITTKNSDTLYFVM